jgi:outer membrane protein TolC
MKNDVAEDNERRIAQQIYDYSLDDRTVKYRIVLILLFTISLSTLMWAQDAPKRAITLDEAILLARTRSVDAAVALNELKTAYWEYRTYRADLLPEVNFNATLPAYYKQYSSYQNSDGSYSFVRNNYMEMSGNLSIDQNIWMTGGTLSLNTSLDFIKQLTDSKSKQFMSVPFAVKLEQPLFGVNDMKWKRRIQPVKYEEAKATFLSATEQVTMNTINYFFNLLLAKENVAIAQQNLDNANKLYEVAKAKRKMGQISENDVLQLRLNVLKAKSSLTDNESTMKSNMFKLRSFLDISEDVNLEPVVPDRVPPFELHYQEVLAKAQENNAFSRNVVRRQLQADYDVATAKGNLRKITFFAQVGYTGVANRLRPAYDNLKDNQVVEVGVKIPLLDWGKRRGQVQVAKSNREVTESKLRQETMTFDQNLFILVEQFNNQQAQLQIAEEEDTIARKRYDTNVKTFMVGKISTLDLNDAQSSKDDARQKHINELFYFWYYYYQLRSLTLWDFSTNTGIDADIDKIVKAEQS